MFKLLLATACLVLAAPLAYSAPLVTATSSQVVARNYNGLVYSSPVVAAAPAARLLASPLAYSSPYVGASYVSSPYVSSPYVSAPYVGAPAVHYL